MSQKFAHYEIVGPLGAGGMGEVFRARDTRLGRDVALKLLPDAFAEDPERLARFQREAKLLASLNHPNIGAIYGLEEDNGRRALALELIEGDLLSDRIARGFSNTNDALDVARQIAAALDAAHQQGVIHRDLKPGNVMITHDGTVKVLDFGLAKALDSEASSDPNITHSPTVLSAATSAGVILGTAAYMSPEQARGKAVDKRTDIWAFGCVLLEMLTGRSVFAGDTVSDTIAHILGREPDWGSLPSSTPPRARQLLERCLQKDEKRRLRDIGDAMIELEEAMGSTDSGAVHVSDSAHTQHRASRRRGGWLWLLAGFVIGATAVAMVLNNGTEKAAAPDQVSRFELNLLLPVPTLDVGYVDISRDGRQVLYFGFDDDRSRICIRDLGDNAFRVVEGASGVTNPKFSPDGSWISYVSDGHFRKVSTEGSSPIDLHESADGNGTTWISDDELAFVPGMTAGIGNVSSDGGDFKILAAPDTSEGHFGLWWPESLPGGRQLLYCAWRTRIKDSDIRALDLTSGEDKLIVEGGVRPLYTSSGHLLFTRGGDVMAVRFDPNRLETLGNAAPVLRNVYVSPADGRTAYAVSRNGTLVYFEVPKPRRHIAWIDLDGSVTPLIEKPDHYADLDLSPDGRKLSVRIQKETGWELFTGETGRRALTQITFDGGYSSTTWMSDNRTLLTSNLDRGPFELYTLPADGSGQRRLLAAADDDLGAESCSPDGRFAAFTRFAGDLNLRDIYVVDFETGKETAFQATPASERHPRISPNGNWIAYHSSRGGNVDVFVQSVDTGGGRYQVSIGGGQEPEWAPDGNAIYFWNDGTVYRVALVFGSELRAGEPSALFYNDDLGGQLVEFAMHPDGDRFLAILSDGEVNMQPMKVVVNWFEELNRLVPPVN